MGRRNGIAGLILLAGLVGAAIAEAQQTTQQQPPSMRVANAAMGRWPSGIFSAAGSHPAWTHDEGVLLAGTEAAWRNSMERPDYLYIEHAVDPLIGPDGSIAALNTGEHRLVEMQLGRPLMLLFGVTLKKRYFDAATALYNDLQH